MNYAIAWTVDVDPLDEDIDVVIDPDRRRVLIRRSTCDTNTNPRDTGCARPWA